MEMFQEKENYYRKMPKVSSLLFCANIKNTTKDVHEKGYVNMNSSKDYLPHHPTNKKSNKLQNDLSKGAACKMHKADV